MRILWPLRGGMAVIAACSLAGCTIGMDPDSPVTESSSSSSRPSSSSTRAEVPRIDHAALDDAVSQLEKRYGPLGIAVDGEVHGSLTTGAAWSTSKVAIAIAAERAGVADPSVVEAAIAVSDNAAAEILWNAIGGGEEAALAANEVLRDGGDTETDYNAFHRGQFTPYGQTEWALKDQVRFGASLPTLEGAETVFEAMGDSAEHQPYGLAVLPEPRFKGGWGPDDAGRYLVRQFGIVLGPDNQDLPIAIMAEPNDGSYESGQEALTALARELKDSARTKS
ncbi:MULTISPECIES: hypothetical protein [Corynebacterium]|uniref:hypothetical protein n=1 Tax=Corynebacterium TaxID=1716 RepID=UPI00124E23D6|nr:MULTISPECIES: hypothetical protein [Corynebacterium]